MGRSARSVLLGLIALAAAGGCGGNDTPPAPAGATVPRSAPTTAPADPYSVPATIDAAYLNRVFEALDAVDGDATRLIVRTKSLPPAAAERLIAIYSDDELKIQTGRWLDVIEAGMTGYRPDPGNLKTSVVRILSSTPRCVFVVVKRDHSAIAVNPQPVRETFVFLGPLDPVRNKKQLNPTPWMIEGEGFNSDGSMPGDPCAD